MKVINKEYLEQELKVNEQLKNQLEVAYYKIQGKIDYIKELIEKEKAVPTTEK